MTVGQRRIVELPAAGPDDPDGSHTAAVLSAYFAAEHARVFRRLMWQRLAAIGLVASLLRVLTPLLSSSALAGILAILGAVAVGVAVIEWRAEKQLLALLANNPSGRVTFVDRRRP
jgi:hypothetical protein